MHKLRPNTTYNQIAIKLAVPADIPIDVLADGLNEMLRPAMEADDAVFHDYSFLTGNEVLKPIRTHTTDDGPCAEGEVFHEAIDNMPID